MSETIAVAFWLVYFLICLFGVGLYTAPWWVSKKEEASNDSKL
jgi:hypothetical protein